MNEHEAYQFGLFPLALWREGRNQEHNALLALGWSIRNRVEKPGWWGHDYPSVILCPFQYSSFNFSDANSKKFPRAGDFVLERCIQAALQVFFRQVPDPTDGATHYFDKSLDDNPPDWALSMRRTLVIGDFRFYK